MEQPLPSAFRASVTESPPTRRPFRTLGWDLLKTGETPNDAPWTMTMSTSGVNEEPNDVSADNTVSALNPTDAEVTVSHPPPHYAVALDKPRVPSPTRWSVPNTADAAVWKGTERNAPPTRCAPPAWTRPNDCGNSPQPHAQHEQHPLGQVVVLREVFSAIGSKSRPAHDPNASPWANQLDEPQRPSVSFQIPHPVPTRGADTDHVVFSWADIMREGADAAIGKDDRNKNGKVPLQDVPTGTTARGSAHLHANETETKRQPSPLPSLPSQAVGALPQEQLATAARAVQWMERSTAELTHRLLMAERELADTIAEAATLREDLTRSLETAEEPLRERMATLRSMRRENERLRKLLGC